jgi:hypothetical protein
MLHCTYISTAAFHVLYARKSLMYIRPVSMQCFISRFPKHETVHETVSLSQCIVSLHGFTCYFTFCGSHRLSPLSLQKRAPTTEEPERRSEREAEERAPAVERLTAEEPVRWRSSRRSERAAEEPMWRSERPRQRSPHGGASAHGRRISRPCAVGLALVPWRRTCDSLSQRRCGGSACVRACWTAARRSSLCRARRSSRPRWGGAEAPVPRWEGPRDRGQHRRWSRGSASTRNGRRKRSS